MNLPEFISGARRGNAAAQQYLFDQYADRLLLFCRRYVKSREDAEEILLDGFYKFFKGLSSFSYQGEAALYAWLKRIMLNECLMFLRKQHVFTIVSESAAEDLASEEDILDQLSATMIFNLIVQLPVGYRTVFNLYVVEGMGHREIGELLGITEGTSKSQLSKAKMLLQKMLAHKNIEYVKRSI